MTRHHFLAFFAVSIFQIMPGYSAEKPNFVLIMCDDLGWADVGFNGGKHIRTANLDKMAANGLTLSRFYAQAPVCSPTRASIVTGRHHDRTGIYTANNGHLRKGEFTIYEALASKGYATGHFGKWHMGTLTTKVTESNRGAKSKKNFSPPWHHAVDTTFATEAKVPTYDAMWKPAGRSSSDFTSASKNGWHAIPEDSKRSLYGTHYWTGLDAMVAPESKTLLGDDSKVIVDHTLNFISKNKEQPFVAIVWFHAPHLPVVASPKDVKSYNDGKTTGFQQNYYGCVTALDRAVGRVRDSLREYGIADNTVVTFCSDNGPEGKDGAPGQQGPFRGRKRSLYEGGVRVPSLIEWPVKIKAGSTSGMATCTVDYLPTILEITGIEMPDNRPLDGISLVPLIEGKETKRSRALGFHIKGQAAWHDGTLKAYRGAKSNTWELYDLASDPGETKNLATEKQQRLKKMIQAWTTWKASVDASDQGQDY
jgi:arylsulfatase A-like enzyme